jgi:hypothetical protein
MGSWLHLHGVYLAQEQSLASMMLTLALGRGCLLLHRRLALHQGQAPDAAPPVIDAQTNLTIELLNSRCYNEYMIFNVLPQ